MYTLKHFRQNWAGLKNMRQKHNFSTKGKALATGMSIIHFALSDWI